MEFRKIKAWARLIFTLVLALMIVLVFVMNRNNRTDLWLFYRFEQLGVIWLIFATALSTLLGYWVVRGVRRAYRDVKKPAEQPRQMPGDLGPKPNPPKDL